MMNDEDKPAKKMTFVQKNQQQFADLKKLDLPAGHYAITGSGPLGIRNLRAIGDIDIIVSSELWDSLAAKFGIVDEDGLLKISFPGGNVEAFGERSFDSEENEHDAPTIPERIANAEMIEGLPFESLEYIIYFKRKMGREKDLNDIILIESSLKGEDLK